MSLFRMIAVAGLAASASAASADILLTDQNASARFLDDAPGVVHVEWTVDGQSQLARQDFYIQVNGGSVAALSSFEEIGTITTGTNTLAVRYIEASLGVQIDVSYALSGGPAGSGLSDMGVGITISNISGQQMDFNFLQFSDFNLGGTLNDASGQVLTQGHSNGQLIANTAVQNDSGIVVSESVVAPNPTGFQIGGRASVLGGVESGALSGSTIAGFGDIAWAFQWEGSLANNASFNITKDLRLSVPAPGAASLGLIGVLAVRRRR